MVPNPIKMDDLVVFPYFWKATHFPWWKFPVIWWDPSWERLVWDPEDGRSWGFGKILCGCGCGFLLKFCWAQVEVRCFFQTSHISSWIETGVERYWIGRIFQPTFNTKFYPPKKIHEKKMVISLSLQPFSSLTVSRVFHRWFFCGGVQGLHHWPWDWDIFRGFFFVQHQKKVVFFESNQNIKSGTHKSDIFFPGESRKVAKMITKSRHFTKNGGVTRFLVVKMGSPLIHPTIRGVLQVSMELPALSFGVGSWWPRNCWLDAMGALPWGFSRWWQLKDFWNFHPENWGRWTHFDVCIFFKWVGSTTN